MIELEIETAKKNHRHVVDGLSFPVPVSMIPDFGFTMRIMQLDQAS